MAVATRLLPIHGTLSFFSFIVIFLLSLNSFPSQAERDEPALVTNIPDGIQTESNNWLTYLHCPFFK